MATRRPKGTGSIYTRKDGRVIGQYEIETPKGKKRKYVSGKRNSGELCVLVHRSTWETDKPAYELYDADKHVSYWMHEVPTPGQAATLLEEHGEPSEDAE